MSRATAWDEGTRGWSPVASTLAGAVLGLFAGLMLAGLVVLAGGALVIWDGLFSSGGHHFSYLVSAAPACVPAGTIGGGLVAYLHASRLGAPAVPSRPDVPAP